MEQNTASADAGMVETPAPFDLTAFEQHMRGIANANYPVDKGGAPHEGQVIRVQTDGDIGSSELPPPTTLH